MVHRIEFVEKMDCLSVQNRISHWFRQNQITRKAIYSAGRKRAAFMVSKFDSHLSQQDKILDIGSGACNIAECLLEDGFDVQLLDVADLSYVQTLKPSLYDGQNIPFADKRFDVSLLITVLHHVPDPAHLIREAARTSRKIVIIEDIYSGTLHKHLTFFLDSMLNLEFFGHPRSNMDDQGWKRLFENAGLDLATSVYFESLFVIKHALYVLDT